MPLEISIYDISGKRIYSASDKINFILDRNTTNFTNGYYFLRLEDKKGNSTMMNFIIINDAIIINNRTKEE